MSTLYPSNKNNKRVALAAALALLSGSVFAAPPAPPAPPAAPGAPAAHVAPVATPLAQPALKAAPQPLPQPKAPVANMSKLPAIPAVPHEETAASHAKAKHAVKKRVKKHVAKKHVEKKPKVDVYAGMALTRVSNVEYNRFVFPEPFTKVLFPPETHFGADTQYLDGNRVLLFQPAPGSKAVTQMIVALQSGKVLEYHLKPAEMSGVVLRVDGARDVAPVAKANADAEAPATGATSPGVATVPLLEQMARSQVPGDFEQRPLPQPTRFDQFTANPLMVLSNGADRRIYVFQLKAVPGHAAYVSPSQFYRQGVLSVMVEGDRVDAHDSPLVYIVEEAQDGGQ